MRAEWIRPVFVVAAVYDFVLGIVFAAGFKSILPRFQVPLPNHDAYVQLPAALIAIFGIGFWYVSRDPIRNRDLIRMGVLLKLAFSGIVLGHFLAGTMPVMWVPFAVADLVFMVLFIAALGRLGKTAPRSTEASAA